MNYEQANEHLAVEVMGWMIDEYGYYKGVDYNMANWNPHQNNEQLKMVLDTFPSRCVQKLDVINGPEYQCRIGEVFTRGKVEQDVIYEAVLKASGYVG